MLSSISSFESLASTWTVHSTAHSRALERYASFEHIPASPRVKSKRVSVDDAFGSGLALSVLRDSYKGFDGTDNMSPRIRKLQKNFSFHNSLQDFKAAVNIGDEKGVENAQRESETEDQIEILRPEYRSISIAQSNGRENKEEKPRPTKRKVGIALHRNLSFDGLKKSEVNLRKEILKQTLPDFKSCENFLLQGHARSSRRDSAESVTSVPGQSRILMDSYHGIRIDSANVSSNLQKLQKNFSFVSTSDVRDGVDRGDSDAKYEYISTNTSNTLDLSSDCDCQICNEEDRKYRMSIWRRIFRKMFMNAISIDDKGHWDENNNVDAGEMYTCVMQTFKLLFGLWLRHFDHN